MFVISPVPSELLQRDDQRPVLQLVKPWVDLLQRFQLKLLRQALGGLPDHVAREVLIERESERRRSHGLRRDVRTCELTFQV